MVTVKLRIKKNNGAEALSRRDKVLISKLWMGNTSPECGDCGDRLTFDHLQWDCPTFRRQRIECNISREILSRDEDEIRRLIKYVQKIGVHHEI
jgi:hypothetical protein